MNIWFRKFYLILLPRKQAIWGLRSSTRTKRRRLVASRKTSTEEPQITCRLYHGGVDSRWMIALSLRLCHVLSLVKILPAPSNVRGSGTAVTHQRPQMSDGVKMYAKKAVVAGMCEFYAIYSAYVCAAISGMHSKAQE